MHWSCAESISALLEMRYAEYVLDAPQGRQAPQACLGTHQALDWPETPLRAFVEACCIDPF